MIPRKSLSHALCDVGYGFRFGLCCQQSRLGCTFRAKDRRCFAALCVCDRRLLFAFGAGDSCFALAFIVSGRVHELERLVGRLAIENDFLKKLLQKLESDS